MQRHELKLDCRSVSSIFIYLAYQEKIVSCVHALEEKGCCSQERSFSHPYICLIHNPIHSLVTTRGRSPSLLTYVPFPFVIKWGYTNTNALIKKTPWKMTRGPMEEDGVCLDHLHNTRLFLAQWPPSQQLFFTIFSSPARTRPQKDAENNLLTFF